MTMHAIAKCKELIIEITVDKMGLDSPAVAFTYKVKGFIRILATP